MVTFVFNTVDVRIRVRSLIARLREDPAVLNVRTIPVHGQRDILPVNITLGPGFERPSDSHLTDEVEQALIRAPEPPEPPRPPRSLQETINAMLIPRVEREMNTRRNWADPIRRNIDYQGTARRTFLLDSLPDPTERLAWLPAPVTFPGWVVSGAWTASTQFPDFPMQIDCLLRAEEQDRNGPTYVRLHLAGIHQRDVEAGDFIANWHSHKDPIEAPSLWERLLSDDDLF
jgi:hypothetical protein